MNLVYKVNPGYIRGINYCYLTETDGSSLMTGILSDAKSKELGDTLGKMGVRIDTPNTEADPHQQELVKKLTALVVFKFGGDYHKAWNYYSHGLNHMDRDDVKQILLDAGIGNWLTRAAWVRGIMDAVDVDKDDRISELEFQTVLQGDQT